MNSIKKSIKKERVKLKRNYFVSYFILILVAYLTYVIINLQLLSGWEVYFAIFYAMVIEFLLILNIAKLYFESKFKFEIVGDRLKIKESFKQPLSFPTAKVVYVDVISRKDEFDIIIALKGKRAKRFLKLNKETTDGILKRIYKLLYEKFGEEEFYYYIFKKGGAKKYFCLYKLYKNCFEAEFSRKAMEYIKVFMDEYNLS